MARWTYLQWGSEVHSPEIPVALAWPPNEPSEAVIAKECARIANRTEAAFGLALSCTQSVRPAQLKSAWNGGCRFCEVTLPHPGQFNPELPATVKEIGFEVWLRVAIEPKTVSLLPAFDKLVRQADRYVHAMAFETWWRQRRDGRTNLPEFGELRKLTGHLAALGAGRWSRGKVSLGATSSSKMPFCLLHNEPHLLPFFRIHGSEQIDSKQSRLFGRCKDCSLAPWCPPAGTGLVPDQPAEAWIPSVMPFPKLPDSMVHLGREASEKDHYSRALRVHVPGLARRDFARLKLFDVDAHLWGGGHVRLTNIGKTDLPHDDDERSLDVLLVRFPGYSLEETECSTLLAPMSLIRLGSVLRARGHQYRILDLSAMAQLKGLLTSETKTGRESVMLFSWNRISEEIQDHGPFDILAISTESSSGAQLAGEVVTGRPQEFSEVVLGGRGVEDGIGLLKDYSGLDYVVEGEGDAALAMLVHCFAADTEPRLVPGLCFRTPRAFGRQAGAYQSFDIPARPDLTGIDHALYPDTTFPFQNKAVIPYQFVQGCPYHCAFCGDYTAGEMRTRDPDQVVTDLAVMHNDFGAENFFFLNTLFNASPAYVDALLPRLLKQNLAINWCDSAKPCGLTPKRLSQMREAGCVALTWGIDAASARLSKRYDKGFSLPDAGAVLRNSHQAGITNIVNLIAGLPHEGEEDICETIDWLHAFRDVVTHVNVMPYRFMAHSRMFVNPGRFGMQPRPDRKGFDEDGGLSWEDKQLQIKDSLERTMRVVGDLGYSRTTKGSNF
jgi:hypothetical protein